MHLKLSLSLRLQSELMSSEFVRNLRFISANDKFCSNATNYSSFLFVHELNTYRNIFSSSFMMILLEKVVLSPSAIRSRRIYHLTNVPPSII